MTRNWQIQGCPGICFMWGWVRDRRESKPDPLMSPWLASTQECNQIRLERPQLVMH